MSKRNKHKEQETEKKLNTQHEEMDAGTVMDEKKVEEQAAATDNQPETQGEAATTDPLAEAQSQIEELKDRYLRTVAEFENFRNRSEKEKSAMFEIGAKSVVEKMLPVVDNLERGFDGLSDEEKETPFAKGIEAVYKQLLTGLEEIGVTPISSNPVRSCL